MPASLRKILICIKLQTAINVIGLLSSSPADGLIPTRTLHSPEMNFSTLSTTRPLDGLHNIILGETKNNLPWFLHVNVRPLDHAPLSRKLQTDLA